eukprot:Lithocolla_globosa_v1_NODE_3865_length_1561_cov_6.976096.p3 type:complete len:114 gc:universal NODE_3865_length_1561_cov_6.976096:505-164(-)
MEASTPWPRLLSSNTALSTCCTPSCTRVHPKRRSLRRLALLIWSGRVSRTIPIIRAHFATVLSCFSSSKVPIGRNKERIFFCLSNISPFEKGLSSNHFWVRCVNSPSTLSEKR